MSPKPKAILVEIDGTLCDDSHRKHFVVPNTGCSICNESKKYIVLYDSHCLACGEVSNWKADYDSYHAAMGEDRVNEWAKSICFAAPSMNCSLFFVTDRPEQFRKTTEDCLARIFPDQIGGPSKLFMRPDYLYPTFGVDNGGIITHHPEGKMPLNGFKPFPDHRPSSIVKKELYERGIARKYDVLFVLESDTDCAAMYRDLGLTVLVCK